MAIHLRSEGIVWAITRLVLEIIWVCFQVYFTTFFQMKPIISGNYVKAVYFSYINQ
jgi:hypothetical protein